MNRVEWTHRYAERIVARSDVTLTGALFIAEAAWYDRVAQGDTTDPEDAADDELDAWAR